MTKPPSELDLTQEDFKDSYETAQKEAVNGV